MPLPKRAVEGAIARSRTRLFKLPDSNRLGEQSNKNGPAVLAGPKFAMLRRSALAAGGAGRDHRCRRCLRCCTLLRAPGPLSGHVSGAPWPLPHEFPIPQQSSAPLRLHRQVRLLDEPGGDLRRGGHKIRERRDRPLRRSRSRRTNGGWLPFGHHSFQVSPAQYPRPVCSRNVMLGPGFQVSS